MVSTVIVALGPLPSESVTAYTGLAREQLQQLAVHPRGAAVIDRDLLDRFEAFHDEWDRVAAEAPEFVWHRELDHAFLPLVGHRAARRAGGGPGGPRFLRLRRARVLAVPRRAGLTRGQPRW